MSHDLKIGQIVEWNWLPDGVDCWDNDARILARDETTGEYLVLVSGKRGCKWLPAERIRPDNPLGYKWDQSYADYADSMMRSSGWVTDEMRERAGIKPTQEEIEEGLLQQALDTEFPSAKSREIVMYQGKKYRLTFYPADTSRSGKTVYRWLRYWKEHSA